MTPRVLWWDGRTGLAYYGAAHCVISRPPKVLDLQLDVIDYDTDRKIGLVRERGHSYRPLTVDEKVAIDQLLIGMLDAMMKAVCG